MGSRSCAEAGRRRGEAVLGLRLAAQAYAADANFGVRLNPPKRERLSAGEDDLLIVLARA